jgi:hypothetical protein
VIPVIFMRPYEVRTLAASVRLEWLQHELLAPTESGGDMRQSARRTSLSAFRSASTRSICPVTQLSRADEL